MADMRVSGAVGMQVEKYSGKEYASIDMYEYAGMGTMQPN
jgi:hypothetical protein